MKSILSYPVQRVVNQRVYLHLTALKLRQTLCVHDNKRCNLIWGKPRQPLTTVTWVSKAKTTVNKQETRVTLRLPRERTCERFKTHEKRAHAQSETRCKIGSRVCQDQPAKRLIMWQLRGMHRGRGRGEGVGGGGVRGRGRGRGKPSSWQAAWGAGGSGDGDILRRERERESVCHLLWLRFN